MTAISARQPLELEENILAASKIMVNILAESLLSEKVEGLTTPQFRTLDMVCHGLDKPSEIARMLGVSAPAVSWIIDRLETSGLLKRSISLKDRRRTVLELTGMGKDIVHRVNVRRKAYIREIVKGMDTGQILDLEASLEAFKDSYLGLKESKAIRGAGLGTDKEANRRQAPGRKAPATRGR